MSHPLDPVAVIQAAREVFPKLFAAIKDDDEMRGRGGGYVCIADITGAPLLTFTAGEILPEENRLRYLRNALEKAHRLSLANALAGHLLSRDTANALRERWIGGVVVPKRFVFAFSGLPGDGDEAFMVLLALRLGEITADEARLYLKHNKYRAHVRALIKAFEQN